MVTWRWKERAAEHDRQQHAQRMAEEAEASAAMIQRHITIALAAQQKVIDWLRDPANKLRTPQDVILFTKTAIDVECQARGVPSVLFELSSMTNEQLLERYAGLIESLRAATD